MKRSGKRWMALLLALLLAMTVVACGEKDDPTATDHGDDGESKAANDSTTAFSVTYQSTKLTLGSSASAVLSKLGDPIGEPREVFDCGAGNSRMYYRYASLELYVMKSADGTTVIDQIELNDDLPQTDKGICIGSSVDEVRAAYGTPAKDEAGELRYTSGNQSLIFNIADGKVTDIGLLRVTQ